MTRKSRQPIQFRSDIKEELERTMKNIEAEENRKRMMARQKMMRMTPNRFAEGIIKLEPDLKKLNWDADLK